MHNNRQNGKGKGKGRYKHRSTETHVCICPHCGNRHIADGKRAPNQVRQQFRSLFDNTSES